MASTYSWDTYHQAAAYRMKYPDENVIRFLAGNFPRERRAAARVLDLGCGAGRHVALLAREGFQAYGVDGSEEGLAHAREALAGEGLVAHLRRGPLTRLPYDDGFFDGVIEVSVLIHNRPADIRTIVAEVHRVLRPGGRGFFLLLSTRDFLYGRGPEVEPSTFLIEEADWVSSRETDAPRPPLLYHLFDRAEVDRLFQPFATVRVEALETTYHSLAMDAEPRRKSYWVIIVEK